MKIITTKEDLLKAILPLKKVLSQTTRDGFKDNLLILNIGKDVFFHAFSDELCLTSKISFDSELDTFKIAVNLDKLSRFVSSCAEDSTVKMNISKSRVTVSCDKSKILLPITDAAAYPQLPSPKRDNEVLTDTFLSCEALLEGLLIAETGLPNTEGIYRDYESIVFDPSDEEGFIRMVATKGTFLVMHKIPGVLSQRFKLRATSLAAVKEVLKRNLGEDCELLNGDAFSYIKIENALISIRNLDEKYPAYLEVFPTGNSTSVEIKTEDIQTMATRARLIEDSAGILRVDVQVKTDRLEIQSETQQGAFFEDIDYIGEHIPEGLETQFSVNVHLFALTAKAARAKSLKMSFYNPNAPILIQSSNRNTVCLFMPIKQR